MNRGYAPGPYGRGTNPQAVAFRRIMNRVLGEAVTNEEGIIEAYFEGEPPTLTKGQIKKLQEHKCRIYMKDNGGWYWLELNDAGEIVKGGNRMEDIHNAAQENEITVEQALEVIVNHWKQQKGTDSICLFIHNEYDEEQNRRYVKLCDAPDTFVVRHYLPDREDA